jgi:hypothetical protein
MLEVAIVIAGFFQMEKHLRQVRIQVEYKIEYADPIWVTAGERVSVG